MKGRTVEDALLVMDERDTVATALDDLEAGREFELDVPFATEMAPEFRQKRLTVLESVPFGHKVALVPAEPGDPVYKYGESIGTANQHVERGEHVHTHNLESDRARGDLAREGSA